MIFACCFLFWGDTGKSSVRAAARFFARVLFKQKRHSIAIDILEKNYTTKNDQSVCPDLRGVGGFSI